MIRRVRLLVWYRVIPMVIVALFGLVSFSFAYAPAPIFRLLYPLEYQEQILQSATAHGVDPYLVAAVIETESGWDASAVSDSGAHGLMQLLPTTAEEMVERGLVDASAYDASDLDDPATNIEIGCAYLSYLIAFFNGSTDHAIAAYNAGMGNVQEWAQQDTALSNAIAFPETQAYLTRVTMARERYRELYPTSFVS